MQQQGQITDDGSVTFPDKVAMSIERLRHFEPPEGYYLAFSGGKDSIVIYDLAVKAGVKFDAHYNNTGIDPPELYKFIRDNYPDVTMHRPKETIWKLIVQRGIPPTRKIRYCCEYLKEGGGDYRIVVTGVRWEESSKRAKYQTVQSCQRGKTKTYLHPILDWATEDIWYYIHKNELPYCHLYDEGFHRLGCIMCPVGNWRNMEKEAARWPRYRKLYIKAFEKMLEKNRAKHSGEKARVWHTPEDVMRWWIYSPPKGDPDQGVIFE